MYGGAVVSLGHTQGQASVSETLSQALMCLCNSLQNRRTLAVGFGGKSLPTCKPLVNHGPSVNCSTELDEYKRYLVFGVDVGSGFNQQFDRLTEAMPRNLVQRRVSILPIQTEEICCKNSD